jgi:hypothetical protein
MAAFPGQKRINVSDRHLAERAVLLEEITKELFDMPAAIADCNL